MIEHPTNEKRITIEFSITEGVAKILATLDDAGGGDTQPLEMRCWRVLHWLTELGTQLALRAEATRHRIIGPIDRFNAETERALAGGCPICERTDTHTHQSMGHGLDVAIDFDPPDGDK